MSDEMELFTLRYSQDAGAVWPAVKRALATMDLRDADDETKTARFGTGVTWTSWGEHMIAQVTPGPVGCEVTVRGRPKGSFLTTKVGERLHAREIRKDLDRAIRDALTSRVT